MPPSTTQIRNIELFSENSAEAYNSLATLLGSFCDGAISDLEKTAGLVPRKGTCPGNPINVSLTEGEDHPSILASAGSFLLQNQYIEFLEPTTLDPLDADHYFDIVSFDSTSDVYQLQGFDTTSDQACLYACAKFENVPETVLPGYPVRQAAPAELGLVSDYSGTFDSSTMVLLGIVQVDFSVNPPVWSTVLEDPANPDRCRETLLHIRLVDGGYIF